MRLLLLNAAVAVGVGILLACWPSGKGPVAVLALSGDVAAIVAKADGRFVSAGPVAGSIIAISDHADFASRLYAAGAQLVLAAQGRACGTTQTSKK